MSLSEEKKTCREKTKERKRIKIINGHSLYLFEKTENKKLIKNTIGISPVNVQ